MADVIRLSKKNIEGLEKLRSSLIAYYKKLHSDDPELIEYEVDHWSNASYNEIIDRAAFSFDWELNH